MKVVKIVKTIGPEGNWERVSAWVDRKRVKMSVVEALLAEDGWEKHENTHVEKTWGWLPTKEITTISMRSAADIAETQDFLRRHCPWMYENEVK